MEDQLIAISEWVQALWAEALLDAGNLILPSRLYQFAILAGCILAAWGLKRIFSPRFRDWMRARDAWPKWQLRALLHLDRRLGLLFFVILTWTATGIMAELTPFPSRRFILTLAATIATAWLLVSVAVRLVRNRFLRQVVTWGLWIYVTLYYLGVADDAGTFLDSVAIEMGKFRLSLLAIVKAVIVMALLFTAVRLFSVAVSGRIRDNEDISPTMRVLLVKIMQITLYGAAFLIGLRVVGLDLTGLAFLSGAIGVGLGFGLQKVVSNLVSGVIILLDKSIKPGDVISIGETFGWINALGGRYVSITTRDGKEYLIPNEDLITGQVVNWTHSNEYVRLDINFGTAYADDPHQVREIAIAAATSAKRVLSVRPPVCHIVGFGDSSVDYVLRFWITDPSAGLTNVRGDVYLALWDAFKDHGISIPFPQREVLMLEGSTLDVAADSGFGGEPTDAG
ncbi:mechanosensitive ion channel family protein [Pontibaca salina]|uniref:Mechanosensitive ion channel n=1 Tax=Pontibaca salina TaxID=2795731 RepID=A0A934M2C3_9RHOB|nr:mechanosensitive ion channel domain-containing protein [Pontibaca salina]MBI6628664.1 mechanosensitive ion channel [Pontibaca salina]